MVPARHLPPRPRNENGGEQRDGKASFTFNVTVDEGISKVMLASLSVGGKTFSLLIDPNSNADMLPYLVHSSQRQSIDKDSTFANNGQLRSSASGEISSRVQENGTMEGFQLKDILWVPVLRCRPLSTEGIRRQGGLFINSGCREKHTIFKIDGTKTDVEERNGCMILRGQLERRNDQVMIHAALSGRKQRLSLKGCGDLSCYIDPRARKNLGEYGFSQISGSSVAPEMRCATSQKSVSHKSNPTDEVVGASNRRGRSFTRTLRDVFEPMPVE